MLLKSLTIVLLLAVVAVVADPSKWRKGKESENKEFNRKVEILFSIVFLFSYLFVLIKFFFFFPFFLSLISYSFFFIHYTHTLLLFYSSSCVPCSIYCPYSSVHFLWRKILSKSICVLLWCNQEIDYSSSRRGTNGFPLSLNCR